MNCKPLIQKLDAVASTDSIAEAFASSRKSRRHLEAFPGELPVSRMAAYAIQTAQIANNRERIVGWKVAMTAAPFKEAFGEERLSGPVFEGRFSDARDTGRAVDWAIFKGGFAAVEAEFIAVMGVDVPAFGRKPTPDEAASLIGALHIGMELAGSPLAAINDIGPFAVTADCGNNDGVVVGRAIQSWRMRSNESLKASVSINGSVAGEGTAANLKGGPLEAVAFLIDHLENRGLRLKAGDIVSTGATTGIHKVRAGDSVVADFGSDGQLAMRVI
jgi:2-keto-4-pentenoate hydratase